MGLARCCFHLLAQRAGELVLFVEDGDVGRRRWRGGVPSRFSSTHLPRLTGEVRVGLDVSTSTLPWVSTPRRGVPSSETFWKSSPVTAGRP